MIPWETLDRALAPDGSALTLVRHGGDYAIGADGTPLSRAPPRRKTPSACAASNT